ncbi:MAG: hypothetical protein LBQ93_07435 [Treponema sp.]|jgi:hypothetical protein|nr:hypothetical protein [Treponema sp.]
MNSKKRFLYFPLLTALALVLAGACGGNQINSAEREDLFSLGIGHMEDQIALYSLSGTRGIKRTGFTMRDGLFYISDGNSRKIARFNSYGDLLFMIYNEETNPPPFSLSTNISGDEQATRWAFSYPLEEPGWIAVDSRRHIFVEDRLPPDAHRTDPETRTLLDGIILHFDQDGRFVNYLGREGIGGSPFSRIVGITASVRDELAVICRLMDGWDIYWFSSSGMLLYLVKLSSNVIPALSGWPEALAVVNGIMASPDSRTLLIKVDYSRDTFDQSTNTRTGSEPINSVIWTLNIEDGSYPASVEIPFYEITENGRPSDVRVFYSMLGVSQDGKALLYFPVETGYSLLFVDTNSREQRRVLINFSNDEIRYNDFFLSTDGVLCAMLADNINIKLVWWRTDRLIGGTP